MPTPDDKSVIVACAAANQLLFFDPVSGREQKRIHDISDPHQPGYSPERKRLVATSLRLDRVDLYDPVDFRFKVRLPAPRAPSDMAFENASEFAFVTLQDSNEVMANSPGNMEDRPGDAGCRNDRGHRHGTGQPASVGRQHGRRRRSSRRIALPDDFQEGGRRYRCSQSSAAR